jgi:poly-D-alanine transfer protein DltD
MESHILGRTRYDAPKKELLHAIVKGYVKAQKLEECQKFLNNVSRNTRRYAYNIAPIQPDTKCYQELEKALMQSTGNQLRNNNADIDQKFKSCH